MRAAIVVTLVALSGCIGGNPFELQVAAPAQWPDIDAAAIRPGVRVLTPTPDGVRQCTANFLFSSLDNATIYVGLAAHCVDGAGLGTFVEIAGLRRAGRLAFDAWDHAPENERYSHDFALIELTAAARPTAHPAMLHFGGPTSLGDAEAILPGEKVLAYGNSTQRVQRDHDNPREGWVLENQPDRNQLTVATDHPGIPGDSGGGLMTATGQAVGVLSLGTNNPADGLVADADVPAANWYVGLDAALAQMAAWGGPDVELATWPLLLGPDDLI